MSEENKEPRDLSVREEADGSAVIEFTDAHVHIGDPAEKKEPAGAGEGAPAGADNGTDDDEVDESDQLSAAESNGKTADELEAIRAHRRAERKHRKEVRQERERMQQRLLEQEREARRQLEERIAAMERKGSGAELANLDNALSEVTNAHNYWKQQIAVATAKGDGLGVADATEKMILARQKHAELINIRQSYVAQQSAPAPLDQRMVNHAQDWMGKNKWYDPALKDEDSRIVRVIDDGVIRDGFDPTTPEYWQELSARIGRRLPHRAGSAAGDGARRDPPPSHVTGSDKGSSQTGAAPKNSFRLSADRVKAMKDAGTWDDPAKRQKQILAFQKYDREHNA